jgi:hypothetical protein
MTLKMKADLETLVLDPSGITQPLDQIDASQNL